MNCYVAWALGAPARRTLVVRAAGPAVAMAPGVAPMLSEVRRGATTPAWAEQAPARRIAVVIPTVAVAWAAAWVAKCGPLAPRSSWIRLKARRLKHPGIRMNAVRRGATVLAWAAGAPAMVMLVVIGAAGVAAAAAVLVARVMEVCRPGADVAAALTLAANRIAVVIPVLAVATAWAAQWCRCRGPPLGPECFGASRWLAERLASCRHVSLAGGASR